MRRASLPLLSQGNVRGRQPSTTSHSCFGTTLPPAHHTIMKLAGLVLELKISGSSVGSDSRHHRPQV